jgi:hypothetical protein
MHPYSLARPPPYAQFPAVNKSNHIKKMIRSHKIYYATILQVKALSGQSPLLFKTHMFC